MKLGILFASPVGSSQVNLIRTVAEILEDITYTDCKDGQGRVVLGQEEYDLLIQYTYSLRKYQYTTDLYERPEDHKFLFFYGVYGRILIEVDKCLVEYEDVQGFFGFSSVGTEIAV